MTSLNSDDDIVICDTDSSDDEVYDIYDDDGGFMDAEKTDGSYYIGLAGYVENQSEPILLSSISTTAFMENEHDDILEYLTEYSTSRVANPALNILKLCVDDRQTYNVVIKTHWLRLIQRKWKNIYSTRQSIINSRKNPSSLRYRNINGKWP